MRKKQILNTVALLMILPLLSGCWTLVAAGAGAYGGYKMKENGYTLHVRIVRVVYSSKKKFCNNSYGVMLLIPVCGFTVL